MVAPAARRSATVEDYLQAIYNLGGDQGRPVPGIRLAERLRLSHPTVVVTVRRLERDGLVAIDPHRKIHLTKQGLAVAEGVVRRHCLAERLLTDILGLEWYKAHEEAHHIEHVLSPDVEERLISVLGNPQRCPHGNPVPGSGYARPEGVVSLTFALPDTSYAVESIDEEVEDVRTLLEHLESNGIRPDAVLSVSPAPEGGLRARLEGGRVVTLTETVAAKVFVRPLAG